MIKIFATDKVKELDQYTIQHEPISSIDLVERAATTFVHEFCRRYSKQVRIVIFAGQGNNGADALAIARLLNEESYRVETYLFNPTEHLSVECEQNKQRLLDMERIEFTEVVRDFEPPTLTDRDVVIDGLFGSGLNRPLTGGSGFINYDDARGRFFKRDMRFHAVRGELTRRSVERMTGRTLDIPTGDGGILASELLDTLPEIRYEEDLS